MRNIWQVSREYAGFAEAGGVKNVTKALAEGLVKQGYSVTQFLPLYGCTPAQYKKNVERIDLGRVTVCTNHNLHTISFSQIENRGVRIIFVETPAFSEKKDIYVYTAADELENPQNRKGIGHHDANGLNVILQKALLEYALLTGTAPDILQCQDAHTALIPVYANTDARFVELFARTGFIVTIHNAGAGYHQQFASVEQALACTGLPETVLRTGILNGVVEPFLLASHFAVMTTVSPWYARELADRVNTTSDGLSSAFAQRNRLILGITNGIEFDHYDPSRPEYSLLPAAFNPQTGDLAGKTACRKFFLESFTEKTEENATLGIQRAGSVPAEKPALVQTGFIGGGSEGVFFAYQGRIARQKGLDVLCAAARLVLEAVPQSRFIITGQGENEIEHNLANLARTYRGRCVFLNGYDRAASRLCIAAADFLVLPSIFEPCGLEDFIGQIFGTLPVAHAVGGLNKIIHEETGFLYEPNTPEVLAETLINLTVQKIAEPDVFESMARYASVYVHETYDWEQVIKTHYIPLYKKTAAERATAK